MKTKQKTRPPAQAFGGLGLTIMAAGLCVGLSPSAVAVPVDLGTAGDYAVVGVGGSVAVESDFEIYQSATVIRGNVAEGPHTVLTHGIDATVIGRWDYDTTDANPKASGFTGAVTGGFVQKDLSGVVKDARGASTTAAGYAATQTYSTLSEGQTITGNGGLNVIQITGDVALKKSLNISGTASDQFVFQMTTTGTGHVLTLSGMTMNLVGGVLPGNILWNLNGSGGDVVISSGAHVDGIFLAPDRQIVSDHGNIIGELIGGGGGTLMSVHSGSQITSPTKSVPDGGSTVALLGVALVGLRGLRGKSRV